MRDTTRVASGHPGMWAEIFLSNKDSLKESIEEAIAYLREMLALMNDSSDEAIVALLEKAKRLRDDL
ncbi:MAG: prephenate dehydrogenase dimerization domain-containing protein, partial [Akkermansiaceae bacterium]